VSRIPEISDAWNSTSGKVDGFEEDLGVQDSPFYSIGGLRQTTYGMVSNETRDEQ
jgi:hypothetical protein